MTNDQKTFASALERAIAHSGVEVLNGEPRLYSLVADFLGNSPQSKQSINLLRSSIDCGIPARMYGAVNKDADTQGITVATCRKLLVDNYGCAEEAAGRFMNEFAAALGWEVAVVETKQTKGMSLEELIESNQNDPEIQFQLGEHYYNIDIGLRSTENEKEAVRWYGKAAQQGHARAQAMLGCFYADGYCGLTQDYAEAIRWLQKSIDQGDAMGQSGLGSCYYNGTGVKRDYAEAVRWYQRAAEQGYDAAQYSLGRCYYKGTGVKKDLEKAAQWLQKAVDQDFLLAEDLLEEVNDLLHDGDDEDDE